MAKRRSAVKLPPKQPAPMLLSDDLVFNLEALSDFLGLTLDSTKAWCAKHNVRPLTHGKTWVFVGRSVRKALEEFAAQKSRPPVPKAAPLEPRSPKLPFNYPLTGSGGPYELIGAPGYFPVGRDMTRDEAIAFGKVWLAKLPAKAYIDIVSDSECVRLLINREVEGDDRFRIEPAHRPQKPSFR